MAGESAHIQGQEGVRDAKRWLEATTRARVPKTVYGQPDLLTFDWNSDREPFSFDLGGDFIDYANEDPDINGLPFYAEVKNYNAPGKQNDMFLDFLRKCFCANRHEPRRHDHFLWITWCPFGVSDWRHLHSAQRIVGAIRSNPTDCFDDIEGTERDEELAEKLDADLEASRDEIEDLARRIWVLVLCDEQIRHLMLPDDMVLKVLDLERTQKGR